MKTFSAKVKPPNFALQYFARKCVTNYEPQWFTIRARRNKGAQSEPTAGEAIEIKKINRKRRQWANRDTHTQR